jgi:hypothetical protein
MQVYHAAMFDAIGERAMVQKVPFSKSPQREREVVMKRYLFMLLTMMCVVGVLATSGCASRRAKKSTAPDVLTPSSMKKPAPVGLIVLSPEYPDFFAKGKVVLLRAPDNWEAVLKLPADYPQEPLVFMINYATPHTIVIAMGNIAKTSPGVELKNQVIMDHVNLVASGEFDTVESIEKYKEGYKIRVGFMVKRPSSDGLMQSVGSFYIMPFPGHPAILFRAFVFGATEEKYDYISVFEKSLESLSLVDLDF